MNNQEIQNAVKFAAFWSHYGIYFTISMMLIATGAVISYLFSFLLLWGIVRDDRGADRVAWIITVLIPFFGPIAYIVHYAAEKDNDWNRKYGVKDQIPRS